MLLEVGALPEDEDALSEVGALSEDEGVSLEGVIAEEGHKVCCAHLVLSSLPLLQRMHIAIPHIITFSSPLITYLPVRNLCQKV